MKAVASPVVQCRSVNHGTFLHIAHEGLISNHSIHDCTRTPVFGPHDDMLNDIRCGFHIVKASEIDHVGVRDVVESIKQRVKNSRVCISVDIDVLDPTSASATGTAEVGGWSTRELLAMLNGLAGLEVVGADVVEVSPPYDNAGETAVIAAAQMAHILLAMMVRKPI